MTICIGNLPTDLSNYIQLFSNNELLCVSKAWFEAGVKRRFSKLFNTQAPPPLIIRTLISKEKFTCFNPNESTLSNLKKYNKFIALVFKLMQIRIGFLQNPSFINNIKLMIQEGCFSDLNRFEQLISEQRNANLIEFFSIGIGQQLVDSMKLKTQPSVNSIAELNATIASEMRNQMMTNRDLQKRISSHVITIIPIPEMLNLPNILPNVINQCFRAAYIHRDLDMLRAMYKRHHNSISIEEIFICAKTFVDKQDSFALQQLVTHPIIHQKIDESNYSIFYSFLADTVFLYACNNNCIKIVYAILTFKCYDDDESGLFDWQTCWYEGFIKAIIANHEAIIQAILESNRLSSTSIENAIHRFPDLPALQLYRNQKCSCSII